MHVCMRNCVFGAEVNAEESALFKAIDTDGDGKLSKDELLAGLYAYKLVC